MYGITDVEPYVNANCTYNILSSTITKVQIKTTEKTKYICIRKLKDDGDYRLFVNMQIEQGDTATTYEEHKEQKIVLDIQKEMLEGDYFDLDRKKEIHTWNKYILTGEEEYEYVATTNIFYTDVFTDKELGKDNFMCTHFKAISSFNYTAMQRCEATGDTNKNNRIIFKYPDVTTETDFKAKIKEQYDTGTPIIVFYKTAETTELDLTEAQIQQLEQLNKLRFYKNVNNIMTTEDIALLQAEYSVNLKSANEKMQQQIDEIKELLSTTQTSAMLINNLQKDLVEEVK